MSTQRRLLGPVFAALVAAASAAVAAPARPHPHFDDRGTLAWYRTLEEACQAARASGKLVFIDYGRLACGNCRRLAQTVLPHPAVRDRLGSLVVGLASDCDRADPRVETIFARGLGSPMMLPFVGIVTPDLRWVTGWSGGIDANSIGPHLALAERALGRSGPVAPPLATRRTPAAAPKTAAPRPAPAVAKPSPAFSPKPVPPCANGDDAEMHCEGGVCMLKPRAKATPKTEPAAAPAPRLATATPADAVPLPKKPVAVATTPGPVASVAAPRANPPVAPRVASPGTTARVASSVPTARPTPAPKPAAPRDDSAPRSLLERARLAAADGRWGEVIRLGNESAKAPPTTDAWEMDLLVRRARTWALDGMNEAVESARKGDIESAAKALERVRKATAGLPVEIDAERGQRALRRLSDIARGSPEASDTPDALRKAAYAEFRGTRWAVLFKAS
jgi:hypothetical protein